MKNVELSRTIGANRSSVWAVLADYPNIADWNSGISASHATNDQTDGVGAKRHCDVAPMGSLEETVVEWEPEDRMVISIDRAAKIPIKHGRMTFTLAEDGQNTAFTMSYDYQAKGGPLSGLIGSVMAGALKKGFNGFLDDLEPAAQARATA